MLRRLICKLNVKAVSGKVYLPGDSLHGVLMENIDTDFANDLHSQGLKPYSQYIEARNGELYWVLQTLTLEAGEQIIDPIISDKFTGFYLKKINTYVEITHKVQSQTEYKELLDRFYFDTSTRNFHLRFITATAFKSGGGYVFYPDWRLVIGSLMRKHSFISSINDTNCDEEVLETLANSIRLVRYDLKSSYNTVENVRLPAFFGTISIKTNAATSLVNYLNFLLHFGEYSGLGIKCSLGMGAMRVIKKQKKGESV